MKCIKWPAISPVSSTAKHLHAPENKLPDHVQPVGTPKNKAIRDWSEEQSTVNASVPKIDSLCYFGYEHCLFSIAHVRLSIAGQRLHGRIIEGSVSANLWSASLSLIPVHISCYNVQQSLSRVSFCIVQSMSLAVLYVSAVLCCQCLLLYCATISVSCLLLYCVAVSVYYCLV